MIKTYLRKYIILEIAILCISISTVANSEKNQKKYILVPKIAVQDTELSKSIARGAEVYTDFCMQCHMADGKGSGRTFPPLAGSNWLEEKRTESIHSVKYGLSGQIKVNGVIYNSAMTPQGLSNDEIADVMNYVMNTWGNTQEKMVTEKEVANVQK